MHARTLFTLAQALLAGCSLVLSPDDRKGGQSVEMPPIHADEDAAVERPDSGDHVEPTDDAGQARDAGEDAGPGHDAGCPDSDHDGFTDMACGGTDCDDAHATVYPGARPICGNGLVEDCNQPFPEWRERLAPDGEIGRTGDVTLPAFHMEYTYQRVALVVAEQEATGYVAWNMDGEVHGAYFDAGNVESYTRIEPLPSTLNAATDLSTNGQGATIVDLDYATARGSAFANTAAWKQGDVAPAVALGPFPEAYWAHSRGVTFGGGTGASGAQVPRYYGWVESIGTNSQYRMGAVGEAGSSIPYRASANRTYVSGRIYYFAFGSPGPHAGLWFQEDILLYPLGEQSFVTRTITPVSAGKSVLLPTLALADYDGLDSSSSYLLARARLHAVSGIELVPVACANLTCSLGTPATLAGEDETADAVSISSMRSSPATPRGIGVVGWLAVPGGDLGLQLVEPHSGSPLGPRLSLPGPVEIGGNGEVPRSVQELNLQMVRLPERQATVIIAAAGLAGDNNPEQGSDTVWLSGLMACDAK